MTYRATRPPLGGRLRRSARSAGFRLKDMAVWLDRPYRRVQAWFSRDVAPRSPDYEHVVEALALLNKAAKNKELAPLQLPLQPSRRQAKIRGGYRAVRRAHSPRRNSPQ